MSRSVLTGFGELLHRYREVFAAAWSMRGELEPMHRNRVELAFLPAQLELVETPVHPAPRWTMRVIVALAGIVLLIGLFGRLDIVVTAKGRLIPNARVKVIQPATTGVVTEIMVADGQRVSAGEPLVKLDASQATADTEKAALARIDAALGVARSRALLEAQSVGTLPRVAWIEAVPAHRLNEAHKIAEGTFREYVDTINAARAALAERQAELAAAHATVSRLEASVAMAKQQASDYRKLADRGFVSQHAVLEKESRADELTHELVAQKMRAQQLGASVRQQRASKEAVQSRFRREQLDAMERYQAQLSQYERDEAKAKVQQDLMLLTAPVSGTVQQLATHTVGGVVTTAQALMEIVPDDTVEAEIQIDNQDIGFIEVGQRVAIKVDAFPYTRYGLLEGNVLLISNNAAKGEDGILRFPARIHLHSRRIYALGRWIDLTPGMAVSADIHTGWRSVGEYFLGPLIQNVQESMRER
jgi:hemolysin D